MKVQELKLKEAEEEADVEKLRVKLLEANDNAKESTSQNSSEQAKSGDAKVMEKLAKKAKNDTKDAKKTLERYNKQIEKVEELRKEIRTEERKLGYKKTFYCFSISISKWLSLKMAIFVFKQSILLPLDNTKYIKYRLICCT